MRNIVLILTLSMITVAAGEEPLPRFIAAHDRWISAVAWSSDGRVIATGSDDQSIKLWDAASGELQSQRRGPAAITALAFHHDGKQLAAGTWKGEFLVWRIGEAQRTVSLAAHTENITALAFSPDGSKLVTGSGDDSAKIWEVATGKHLLTIKLENEYDVTCVAFSPDGKQVVLGDGENTLRVCDARSGEQLVSLVGHEEAVSSVAYLNNQRIVSGSWDDTLRLWDAATGKELRCLRGHGDDVNSLACSGKGERVVSGSADGTARLWDVASGKTLRVYEPKVAVSAVAITADGKRVALGCRGRIQIEEAP